MKGAEQSSNLWEKNKMCIICDKLQHIVLANVDELQHTKTLRYLMYIYIVYFQPEGTD